AEVEDVVVDAELVGDPAGVVDVGHRAAARVGLAAPQLHGDADDLVALLLEERGRDRGVDAARHGDQDPHAGAPEDENARRRSTAAGTASSAASTSASVLDQPSERRRLPAATSRGTPMAASTWLGSWAPEAQEDAADAKTSRSSSSTSSASASMPGMHTWQLPATLARRSRVTGSTAVSTRPSMTSWRPSARRSRSAP